MRAKRITTASSKGKVSSLSSKEQSGLSSTLAKANARLIAKATDPPSKSRKWQRLSDHESTTTLPENKKTKLDLNEAPRTELKVYVCGSGDSGELGFGSLKGGKAILAKTPRLNQCLEGVVQSAIGGMHGVALTKDNKILTWGVNDQFALGRDTPNSAAVFKDIDGQTSADDDDDDDNEVHLNVLESTPTAIDPSAFPLGTKFVQVSAGDSTSFALTSTGTVYGWGIFRDSKGLFGFNVTENNEVSGEPQKTPKLIHGLENIIQIACGDDHALALDKDGSVFAWGAGEHAQLGRPLHPAYLHRALVPLRLHFPKPIASIFAGANHSFGIDNKGHVYSWGLNNFGQCGIPNNAGKASASVSKPKSIKAFESTPVKMVAGGNFHSIALTELGDCMTWGRMDGYQSGIRMKALPLDDSDIISKSESGRPRILLKPMKVPNLTDASYVAAGSDHCIAITKTGKAFSWGFNISYQCGQSRKSASDENSDKDDEDDIEEIKEATCIST